MKGLAWLAIVGILTQSDIQNLIELGERAEQAKVERFWKELQCSRITTKDTSIIVCTKDLEIFTLEEPLHEYK